MTLPHTATVQRKSKVGAVYEYSTVGTTKCFLQPMDMETANAYGATFTKSFSCFVQLPTDVGTGDRLIIDGKTYSVSGYREHNYGSQPHRKLALETV